MKLITRPISTGLMPRWSLAMSLALTGPFTMAQEAPAAAPFVVRGAQVFDGTKLLPPSDVLVQAGRIAAVVPSGGKLDLPAGTTEVNGRGRTLLPGLIDAHTHSWGDARRDALRFGVTTELDMFGDTRALAPAKAQRASLAPVTQADLWSAGTLATVPKGHGTQFGFPIPTLTRPEEAAPFVQARIADGSDYLKIVLEDGRAFGQTLPSLAGETVAALVATAHAGGLQAVVHVSTQADGLTAFKAGADGLAHLFMDQTAGPDFIALARQPGRFVVATLSVAASASGSPEGRLLADDAQLKPWLSTGQSGALRTPFYAGWRRDSFLPTALASVRVLNAAGVTLLAGTDAGNPGIAHGASLHGELALLVRGGLTPVQALAAATSATARAFKLTDRGTIATGQRADLLLVEGDPTRDINATRAIAAVWKNGAAVDRALRDDEKEKPAAAAPAGTLIADFEDGRVASLFGQGFSITSDAMAGGKSAATQAWVAGGADASKGALRVQGTVDGGLFYAWAGTLFMPGEQAYAAVDFSARKTLVFKVRGAARSLNAMLFSGAATQRQPAVVPFAVQPQWAEVRIELKRFEGADLKQLRALAFTAGLPAGPFSFEIDDVRME